MYQFLTFVVGPTMPAIGDGSEVADPATCGEFPVLPVVAVDPTLPARARAGPPACTTLGKGCGATGGPTPLPGFRFTPCPTPDLDTPAASASYDGRLIRCVSNATQPTYARPNPVRTLWKASDGFKIKRRLRQDENATGKTWEEAL
jgi:hypothetical protein